MEIQKKKKLVYGKKKCLTIYNIFLIKVKQPNSYKWIKDSFMTNYLL